MTIDLSEGVNWAKVSDLLEQFRTILEVGLDTGTATGGSSTTLEDTSKDWGTDQWKDAYVEIVEGTGAGQIRKIDSNTSNTITVATAWTTAPDNTSKYRIFGAPSEVRVLNDIYTQLDITLSALRDALRGTDSKTLTDIHNDLYNATDVKSAYDQLKSILGQLNITLSALRDAITTGSTTGATAKALYDLYTDLESLKKALSSIGTDKLLTTPDNPSNLDIAISVLRDALKPDRGTVTQDLSAVSIAASGTSEITKSGLSGYSAIAVMVKATYDASATAGVRVRWLYSPDGTNYDTVNGAENETNYQDIAFTAGATEQETVLVPIQTGYIKIQIVNLDTGYAVTVDVWTQPMR